MLTLSDHCTHQGQTMCTQICLFKATYRLSMSESHHFTVQKVGKTSKSCYHYQNTSPVKDRLSLRAIKYVHSKATYRLSMSESHHFTVQQGGKGANHVTIIRSLHCQGQLITAFTQCVGNLHAEYERITPFHSVASGEKEQIMSPLSLKHVYSKATYRLSMSESHHFTVYQVEKGGKIMLPLSNHFTVKDSLSLHVLNT